MSKSFDQGKIISSEEAKDHFNYAVDPISLDNEETKDLKITVNFMKTGIYRLKKISWKLFEKVPFSYEVPSYKEYGNMRYSFISVNNSAGILEVNSQGLKDTVIFGEIHKSLLVLTNKGQKSIDQLYLVSTEPLFTGFGIKDLGSLESNKIKEEDFYVRGTIARTTLIPLMFVYKTEGMWKYLYYFLELGVKRSFSGTTYTEDLSNGRRLVSVDVIKSANEKEFDPTQIELCSIKLSSNVWRIVKESYRLIKNNQMMLTSFELEHRPDPNNDALYLTRNHNEVPYVYPAFLPP